MLGVFEAGALWATLVLHFDAEMKIDVVTTADPTDIPPADGKEATATAVVDWVGTHYGEVCLGLFVDIADARRFLAAENKVAVLTELHQAGALIAKPVPAGLSALLGKA